MSARRSLPIEQYQVGVVCALSHEMTAAIAILDERHQPVIGQDKRDDNNYVLGQVYGHNVAIACLPSGVYGTNSAGRVARDMLRTFTGLRFGLMVGIGGGIPNLQKGLDIRLGDVVISQPDRTYGGVVQYDLRKNLGEDQFERKGFLKPPPTMLLAALATLQAEHDLDDSQVPDLLAKMYRQHPNLVKRGYGFPGQENDILYCASCNDSSPPASCNLCTDGKIKRQVREDGNPVFWYGVIASGNEMMKNAAARDRIGSDFGALCVEMEAAGLMNDFPCVIIRGICDYADAHKNDAWQKYAALTAAAYAKELLGYISPEQTSLEKPIQVIADHLDKQSRLIEEHLQEAIQENKKQEHRYRNNQYRDCHKALKTSTYEQFKNVNPDRVEGTCQWVLSHSQYLQWLTKAHDNLLWISADPGCGKSVLAKSLVDNELQSTDKHTVCYFFFKDNEEQDNLATALCALLHQLFSHKPRLIQYAIPAWEKTGDKLGREVPELWRTLLAAAVDDEAHDVTCILDALDECQHSDRRWLIDMLARFYTQISPSQPATRQGRLKFLVTSRPYDDIQAEFQKTLDDLPTIRLRGEEENDQIHQEIDLVIRTRVAKVGKDLKLGRQIKNQLEEKLLKMEHRTYLWLYLAIEDIYNTYRDSFRPEEVSIELLPSSVEDAYEKILSRVTEKQKRSVKTILRIVVRARRPLTVQEMAIALGTITSQQKSLGKVKLEPKRLEENIRHWCGLFVFINHARIHLIHQTAKEFLIGHGDFTLPLSGWKHCLHPQEIENDMFRVCVGFLCLEDIVPTACSLIKRFDPEKEIDSVLDKNNPVESFVAYSVEHWPYHLQGAHILVTDSFMSKISVFYSIDSNVYNVWFPIFWKANVPYDTQPSMSLTRLAALLGHGKVLEWILRGKQNSCVNEPDDAGNTALIWASKFGHQGVVQMLLDRGADVHAEGVKYGNALCAASESGHEKVVRMFLDSGADVNAGGGEYGHALQAASESGHEKVVQILVDRGADVNAKGGPWDNALGIAVAYGREKVVQILLDRGADVNAEGGMYGNAIITAAAHGYEKVAEILLDRGADVNAEGGMYGNSLNVAATNGHEKVVQILLDRGADVNAEGELYGNALNAAAALGREKVVQILLDRGVDANAKGGLYGNALNATAAHGHEKVVQILLDRGADVNAKGGCLGNALNTATVLGHEKVVQILLDRGADVNAKGRPWDNALYMAVQLGHEKLVQILLDGGADVNAERSFYGNALNTAAAGGHEKVVQILLDRGADVNAEGGRDGNALNTAAAHGHEKVVQILLNRGADVNAKGGLYSNALWTAAVHGHEKVVQILLDKGADINAEGGEYTDALQAASARGHEKVVQILLDRGADVDTRETSGNTYHGT